MGKQRDEGSESVTQQVQSRDIDVKKSDKFSSEYNLSLLFYTTLLFTYILMENNNTHDD